MTDLITPKTPVISPKDARAARRKAELKANMARRKAQAWLRGAGADADLDQLGGTADHPPDVAQN